MVTPKDPFNKYVTLDNQFDLNIPFLEGIIGDAYLITRDRMGRDLAFYAVFMILGGEASQSTNKQPCSSTLTVKPQLQESVMFIF